MKQQTIDNIKSGNYNLWTTTIDGISTNSIYVAISSNFSSKPMGQKKYELHAAIKLLENILNETIQGF